MTITKDDVRASVERTCKLQDIKTIQLGARALHVAYLRNCTKEVLVQQLMTYWDDAAKYMEHDDFVEAVTEDTWDLMHGDTNKFDMFRRES